MNAESERAAIRKQWPAEFDDGARCGFSWKFDGQREQGGYPKGFHEWPIERRNAWYADLTREIPTGCFSKKKGALDDRSPVLLH
jgi:hypothetical protein